MLRVNVGMSRKLSKDFCSTGFSLNLDGEISVGLDDPEAVVEKIKEFYDLAEESLAQQIERYEGESAIASRDETPRAPAPETTAANDRNRQGSTGYRTGNGNGNSRNGNGHRQAQAPAPPATNKQIQFLLNLAKREGLTTPQLENRVAGILGRETGLYDLTKQEAGAVLDSFTEGSGSRSRR
jgi:hypothetical protein